MYRLERSLRIGKNINMFSICICIHTHTKSCRLLFLLNKVSQTHTSVSECMDNKSKFIK